MQPSPFPPGSPVVAYLRDSGGSDQDLSVEQQEAALQGYCRESGLVLTRVFKDLATTASTTVGRENFLEMIRYFHQNAPEKGILVWKFSRFARDMDDAQFYKADLRRLGYEVFSLNDSIPEGLNGRLMENLIDWMNARFLEDLSTDVKRGVNSLFQTHGALGGTPPRGFKRELIDLGKRRDGKPHLVARWVPDPDIWDACKTAWEMRAAGATYAQIHKATRLYNSLNSYNTFFANRIYLGELTFGDQVVPDYVPAMVDQPTWDAVQKINAEHKVRLGKTVLHPRRISSQYLLSGLLFCGYCGAPLNAHTITMRDGRAYYYYRCSARKRRAEEEHVADLPRDLVERETVDYIRRKVLNERSLMLMNAHLAEEWGAVKSASAADKKRLSAQRTTIRKAMKNIHALVKLGKATDSLLEELRRLEVEERELSRDIARTSRSLENIPAKLTEIEVKQLSETISAVLLGDDHARIKTILQSYIQKIEVSLTGNSIEIQVLLMNPMLVFMSKEKCPHTMTLFRYKYTFRKPPRKKRVKSY